MSKLLLNLRHVPDDEADDVRALLKDNGISFYETVPGPWGFSAGGIWLNDEADAAQAKRLMAQYQAARATRARAEYDRAVREGRAETFAGLLRAQPLRVLLIMVAILFLLYLMAWPLLLLDG